MIRLPMGGSKHKRPAIPADEAYGASIAAGARKKHKAVVAFGRGEENSMALLRNRHRRNMLLTRTLKSYLNDRFHTMVLILEIKIGMKQSATIYVPTHDIQVLLSKMML
ncbi:uncharacterized protein LOC133896443 [Phragmites australis]|uniref:uncharacterized protein LOC133896443 n=1 Tax=Phragmites australis TaxID=29695 RepID=UPI002D7A0E2F|nr:uncharacterized protein LOC133896443 [Phragmites australis]